jgi:hypothetical protein
VDGRRFAAHPGAVRIDQDPAASDPTADVLDIEAGAATPASAPGWVRRAAPPLPAGAGVRLVAPAMSHPGPNRAYPVTKINRMTSYGPIEKR